MPRPPEFTFILDPAARPVSDFRAINNGTIWTFYPLTLRAEDWWGEEVGPTPTIGGAYAVDHRYAHDIIDGMTKAGLTV